MFHCADEVETCKNDDGDDDDDDDGDGDGDDDDDDDDDTEGGFCAGRVLVLYLAVSKSCLDTSCKQELANGVVEE